MTLHPTPETHPSPWHEGERRMQRAAGVADQMETAGRRVLRDWLIPQHRDFFPLLPFVVLGAVAPGDTPWATLRAGAPGFLATPDEHTLTAALARDPADPAEAGMTDGAAIALLGIDLGTRRRNRLNGVLARTDAGLAITVRQSFGNCPRYIQARAPRFVRNPAQPSPAAAIDLAPTDPRVLAQVAGADTFFVASHAERDGQREVDVSHRGGRPGFVSAGPGGVLTIPDFPGNAYFNTLGNILATGRAGLAFPDFDTGDLLQMTGDAEILPAPSAAFPTAERFWRFHPRRVVLRPDALPLRWHMAGDGWSPHTLAAGTWARTRPGQEIS